MSIGYLNLQRTSIPDSELNQGDAIGLGEFNPFASEFLIKSFGKRSGGGRDTGSGS